MIPPMAPTITDIHVETTSAEPVIDTNPDKHPEHNLIKKLFVVYSFRTKYAKIRADIPPPTDAKVVLTATIPTR